MIVSISQKKLSKQRTKANNKALPLKEALAKASRAKGAQRPTASEGARTAPFRYPNL